MTLTGQDRTCIDVYVDEPFMTVYLNLSKFHPYLWSWMPHLFWTRDEKHPLGWTNLTIFVSPVLFLSSFFIRKFFCQESYRDSNYRVINRTQSIEVEKNPPPSIPFTLISFLKSFVNDKHSEEKNTWYCVCRESPYPSPTKEPHLNLCLLLITL